MSQPRLGGKAAGWQGGSHDDMATVSKSTDREKARIMLGLLDSVERGSAKSQRSLASELGIALGLVNTYLKRCVRKGLVKVRHAPARRYAYYLTPNGFAEKSRLTVEYMSYSFSLFRRAKTDCAAAMELARARGFKSIALLGASDIAEIAAICALDSGVSIGAVVDARSDLSKFIGVPLVKSLDDVVGAFDAVLVTDIVATQDTISAAIAHLGAERVLVPELLAPRAPEGPGSAT
jgi:DNA-binding MarR family transcriptional regulator